VSNWLLTSNCAIRFFDARDAIIQADEILTKGENACELWQGFSERGLVSEPQSVLSTYANILMQGPDAEIVGNTPWGGGRRTDVSWLVFCVIS